MSQYTISPEAIHDLEEIIDYFTKGMLKQAIRYSMSSVRNVVI
jgi:plasmid stabilization system protein ParE